MYLFRSSGWPHDIPPVGHDMHKFLEIPKTR